MHGAVAVDSKLCARVGRDILARWGDHQRCILHCRYVSFQPIWSTIIHSKSNLHLPQERNCSRCRHRSALLQRGVQPTLHGTWRRLPHDRLPCQWHGGEIFTLSRKDLKLRLHDDQLSLVAREMAPSASNRDMYSKGRSSKNGPAASGVPGKGKGLIPRVPSFANSIQLLKKKY